MSWKELFPEGRIIFYEGDDPEGFVKEIKERFGYDIMAHTYGWTKEDDRNHFNEEDGYSFHCPPEILDEVYTQYPMGS